jgi:hypothetical protein
MRTEKSSPYFPLTLLQPVAPDIVATLLLRAMQFGYLQRFRHSYHSTSRAILIGTHVHAYPQEIASNPQIPRRHSTCVEHIALECLHRTPRRQLAYESNECDDRCPKRGEIGISAQSGGSASRTFVGIVRDSFNLARFSSIAKLLVRHATSRLRDYFGEPIRGTEPAWRELMTVIDCRRVH